MLTLSQRVIGLAAEFEKNKELSNIQRIIKSLRDTTPGIRLEVSFQNLGAARLLQGYDEMSNLAYSVIDGHLQLQTMSKEQLIPQESLRFSPVQLVTTSSLTAMIEHQATTLHAMFEAIFRAAMKGTKKLAIESL